MGSVRLSNPLIDFECVAVLPPSVMVLATMEEECLLENGETYDLHQRHLKTFSYCREHIFPVAADYSWDLSGLHSSEVRLNYHNIFL